MRIFPQALVISLCATLAIGCAPTQEEGGAQEPLLDVPSFQPCEPDQRPILPEKWEAIALMAPFSKGQLIVGQLVYDSSVPAFRGELYGLEAGSADILVTDEASYLLEGPPEKPTGCQKLSGVNWKPPSRDWLGPEARCVGEAPVVDKNSQWWKVPAEPEPSTTWYWYTKEGRMPWRTMFASESDSPSLIGSYSMTNFPTFSEVQETSLGKLADMCAAAQETLPSGESRLPELLVSKDEPDHAERIQALIPGLSYSACSSQTLPEWPAQFGMTTFMTAVNFNYDPFPTEVLYQWSELSQRTRMFQPESTTEWADDALLIGGTGYDIQRQYGGGDICQEVLPGIPRPNWMEVDNCQCMGVIEDNPVLSPGETTLIVTCPLVGSRVFWTWYKSDGTPRVFMETESPADEGTGLSLADYYSWDPGASIPPGTFDVPPNCVKPTERAEPKYHHGASVNPACYTCHLGPDSG